MTACVPILLVGCGAHAAASWLPAVRRLVEQGRAELARVVDTDAERAGKHLADAGVVSPVHKVRAVDGLNRLAPATLRILNGILNAAPHLVIVSTPPEAHVAYALWAGEADQHVIVDKPVSARAGAIDDDAAAWGHMEDWRILCDVHARHPDRLLIVNAHRRFEPIYLRALAELRNVNETYSAAVNFVSVIHSDGQFRTERELATLDYHGIRSGTGKLKDSAYHFLDFAACAYAAGTPTHLQGDVAEVSAVLVRASDVRRQFGDDLAGRIFEDHEPFGSGDTLDARELGEIDVHSTVRIVRDGLTAAVLRFDLLHSGISQRRSSVTNPDLYKANGRVRHLLIVIDQGPLQWLDLDSAQAAQPSERCDIPEDEVGSRNHATLRIWQNPLIGDPGPRLVKAADLAPVSAAGALLHEDVKASILELVVDAVKDPSRRDDPRLRYGSIEQHGAAPALTTAMYLSDQRRRRGQDPVVTVPLRLPNVLPPSP